MLMPLWYLQLGILHLQQIVVSYFYPQNTLLLRHGQLRQLQPCCASLFSFNSVSFAPEAAERRRREEGWNDLGLDQLDRTGTALTAAGRVASTQQG